MILNIIVGIITFYGFYFLINGSQTMTKEVRQSWAPQDIEMWQEERNQEKYIGQIILCLVSIYFMFLIV
jgi:hypothetical protein